MLRVHGSPDPGTLLQTSFTVYVHCIIRTNGLLESQKMHRSRLTAIAMDHVASSRLTGRAATNGEGMRRPPYSVMKTLGIDTSFHARTR